MKAALLERARMFVIQQVNLNTFDENQANFALGIAMLVAKFAEKELQDHHPDTGKEIDKILDTITPEEQAKCDADMIEVLERNAAKAAWMAARNRYMRSAPGGNIHAQMAFEKWFNETWKGLEK